jgi:hypothetical protein
MADALLAANVVWLGLRPGTGHQAMANARQA